MPRPQMATPDDHRRQAELLGRLAENTRKPDMAAQLMRLAKMHRLLADQGESPAQQQEIQSTVDDENTGSPRRMDRGGS